MAEAVETASALGPEELSRAGPSSDSLALEADERRQEELRKRSRDPPIVYTDIDVSTDLTKRLIFLNDIFCASHNKNTSSTSIYWRTTKLEINGMDGGPSSIRPLRTRLFFCHFTNFLIKSSAIRVLGACGCAMGGIRTRSNLQIRHHVDNFF